MNTQLSLAFHIIGFVLWVGGTMVLARALAVATSDKPQSAVCSWAWRAFVGYIVPGALLTVLTGLYQILSGVGFAGYFAQGWFHGKVTLILLMFGATVVFGVKCSALSRGESVRKGSLMAIHGIAALMLLGGVLLTMTGRY
jgi:uncharacterized membrane protein